jgi:hypothetical protein
MAEEKKDAPKAILPDADGKCYFIPNENCTIPVAVDYNRETKQHAKHHLVTFKRGQVFATAKQHEIDACKKKGFRQVNKPKPKAVETEE